MTPPFRVAWRSLRRRNSHVDAFSFQDLLVEAAAGVSARPGRLVMTTLGTVLGIASLVVTVGFAQTTSGQISKKFSEVSSTEVIIKPATATLGNSTVVSSPLPWDAVQRVNQLVGVSHAALVSSVAIGDGSVSTLPINDPSLPQRLSPPVIASSPDLLGTLDGALAVGRFFDSGHDSRHDRVAVLGKRAAAVLGVSRIDDQPAVIIGSHRYVVIGIISKIQHRADILDSVVIPDGTARADFGLASAQELQLRIRNAAGPLVAHQGPIALDPDQPKGYAVSAPAAPSSLQGDIQDDVNVIFLVLGFIVLLAGGLGIMNVTLLSVSERTGEIGLRRALGATERNIATQFIAESTTIGLLGGLIGSALGVLSVVMVAIVNQWSPIIDLRLVGGATVLGTLIGLTAGAYPAVRASRIEPVEALRTGV